ncbi:sulfate permease [Hydrogenophilus thiooxidans]|uniref:sulfate permease n=1 Tax=Hydrogenophilus thiooxidans TaxID=2820326 RepID=UPI0024B53F04|nr:sulfate permease [Hydrogenophilus thiooxidans]
MAQQTRPGRVALSTKVAHFTRLFPFLSWLPRVDRTTLRDDLMAGLTGALVVLPQAVAFAIIAGLPPQYGLYAAMTPAVVAALFGSSWHLVSGPTTAISIAVFAAVSPLAEPGTPEYIRLVLTLTFLVGCYELILGIARLGVLVNFISHTVVVGFTAGAALLIAASQVKHFFGIAIPNGTPFFGILASFVQRVTEINPWVFSVSVVTLLTGILTRRYVKQIPYMIAAMLVGSLWAALLNAWFGQERTGIKTVGALPAGLPPLSFPDFSLDAIGATAVPAVIVAFLALTEAVSIARALALRSGQRLDGNQEFIGQGLSNLIGSFFSAYATSGSFNRSGVNFEAGAKTPLASVFASIFLIVILLFVAPLAAYLPNAAMAGILFLVAWGLIDFAQIAHTWRASRSESAILWVTLVGTLFSLEAGIFLGVALTLIEYLYRTSRPTVEPVLPAPEAGAYHFVSANGSAECPQLSIRRITGALYFGSVDFVQAKLTSDHPHQRWLLLACSGLSYLDLAGAEFLAQEARRRRRLGGDLFCYRMNLANVALLRQSGALDVIGENHLFPVRSDVIGAIYRQLDPEICRTCTIRAFSVCRSGTLPVGGVALRCLLATDGSEYARAPTEVAVAWAAASRVPLAVVTVVDHDAEDASLVEGRLSVVKEEAARRHVTVTPLVRHGKDPVGEIVSTARELATHLLIVGRRPPRTTLIERFLGDRVERILLESPCHVLVVHPEAKPPARHIVVAWDGSTMLLEALGFLAHMARVLQLPVTLVTGVSSEAEREAALHAHEEALAALQQEGVTTRSQVLTGTFADAIFSTVLATGADLVVVGNDPRSGLARHVTPSLADQVIGGLSCSVLVIQPATTLRDAAHA